MPRRSLDRVIDDVAASLRSYFADGGHNADLLRSAAASIVELRGRFTREKDGLPDWGGRTTAYRDAIRDAFTRAGMTDDEVNMFRNRSAYYVRQALESRAPQEELEEVGFREEAPKTRQLRKRTTDAAIAAVLSPETTAANRLVFAERLLAQALTEDMTKLTKKQRAVIMIALDRIATHAEVLRGAVAAADAG